jgi:TRAP-type C4-dicarboxylate transport system permease small subunit
VKRLIDVTTKVTEILIIILMACLVTILFALVLMRHIFQTTPYFAEELSRYFLVWVSLLGASLGIKEGSHSAVTFFKDKFPKHLQKHVITTANLIILAFLVAFLIGSVRYNLQQASQMSSTLKISMFYITLAAPLGSILMIIQHLGVMAANKE